jgi:hypothetical protein
MFPNHTLDQCISVKTELIARAARVFDFAYR